VQNIAEIGQLLIKNIKHKTWQDNTLDYCDSLKVSMRVWKEHEHRRCNIM